MGEKQREILGRVIPVYAQTRRVAARSKFPPRRSIIPILPLVCDSDIAGVLASRRRRCRRASAIPATRASSSSWRANIVQQHVRRGAGGTLAVRRLGFGRSLHSGRGTGFRMGGHRQRRARPHPAASRPGRKSLYRPYEWRQQGREIRLIFRDHLLSDLIGFVYSGMEAGACRRTIFCTASARTAPAILAAGRDALVPIILDGENAWEYYDRNGRPFLRELYRRISERSGTARAYRQRSAAADAAGAARPHLSRAPGSTPISTCGSAPRKTTRPGTYLLRARALYDAVAGVSEDRPRLAYEELLIAEGSDWCWWYGPEHDSANRVEFDQLYRNHLANVYRLLNLAPPEELSRPILHIATPEFACLPPAPYTPPSMAR